MGIPRKRDDTQYARYVAKGGKIVALRIPPNLVTQLTERTEKRGMTFQAYIQFALSDFMQREAAKEAEWQAWIEAAREGRQ